MLEQVATLAFKNLDGGDEAYFFVTVSGRTVGFAMALEGDGDMEVAFDTEILDQLISALEEARRRTQL